MYFFLIDKREAVNESSTPFMLRAVTNCAFSKDGERDSLAPCGLSRTRAGV